MARPKKTAGEKRTEQINLRYTLAELEHLQQQAEAAGLSLPDYARRRVLGHTVAPAPRRADAALVSEVNRVGVNVNQLTKMTHLDRIDPDFTTHWRYTLAELRHVLGKVTAAYGP